MLHSSKNLAPPSQLPPGLQLFPGLAGPQRSVRFHQLLVLFLTFMAYASFHASRKPLSIVKSILTAPTHLPDQNSTQLAENGSGWSPFDGPRGPHRLGELDLSFLLSYAVGMYFAGHIGDTIDLRFFLTFGMVGSGLLVILFGLGYFLDLHSFGVFMLIQVLCGLFQSIGWPCVVAVVGNWFGKAKRGLIMGVWSSHTSVGNVIGSIIASSVLGYGWGWAFVLPGFLIILVAVFVYLFLVVHPDIVGLEASVIDGGISIERASLVDFERVATVDGGMRDSVEGQISVVERVSVVDSDISGKVEEEEGSVAEGVSLVVSDGIEKMNGGMMQSEEGEGSVAIGFLDAWGLPNVASYAFCLFFSKLVAYTFLYWLPFYITHTAVAGVHVSHKTAGILSTIFDIGGVFGGILAGLISDKIEARGVTSFAFLVLSIPTLILYRTYGSISMFTNITLMFASGLFVNGPYSLITTAVAADLGTQSTTRGNSRALATVTAIIDGTGSVGAAVGPLLAGYISTRGWNSVFFMLIVSISFAGFLLGHIVINEVRALGEKGKWRRCSILFR